MTWATATAAGSRMAVRLIAVVQARRRRACPSMAARAASVRVRSSSFETRLQGVDIGTGEGWGVLNARRERLARSVHDTPPLVRVPPVRAAPLPASASARTVDSFSVFRGRSGSRPGLPKPLADRVTLASVPVRMPDGRGRGGPASTGLSTNSIGRPAESWITGRAQLDRPELRTGRPSVRRTTSMTSST